MNALRSERGAILVQVAVAMLALVAFSALTVDYGVMWSSRRQAQNSADAGALAGAMALAYDDPADFARARLTASGAGHLNKVFGLQPNIDPNSDVSFPACPPGSPGLPDTCVRVNVYRNSIKDALPTFFAPLFGLMTQGTQATATAQIGTGNASDCLKPWAVADKWAEHVKVVSENGPNTTWGASDTWTTDMTFDKYLANGQGGIDPSIAAQGFVPDEYRAPGTNGSTDPGTGFAPFLSDGVTPSSDYGQVLALKLGSGQTGDRISAGWFKALDMPCVGPDCPQNSGANKFEYNIRGCSGVNLGVGDTIPVETGNMAGATGHGTYQSTGQDPLALVERDPNAYWDPQTGITSSCVTNNSCPGGTAYSMSPRIVPVPLFDVDAYLAANPTGSGGVVTITNIFGFFIITPQNAEDLGFDIGNGNTNDTVYGVMVTIPGLTTGSSTIPVQSAFLRQVILVR
jgi:hypothetical protein